MKQKKNTALYILIAAIAAAFLLTTVLFIGIVNLHRTYSEYLIKYLYNSRAQATSTLIRAMLDDNCLDRYRQNEEYDKVSEAALSSGYTDDLPSYIRQKYVKKLMPYIIGYVIIMIIICGVIIYYFTAAKKKYESSTSHAVRELEALKLKYEMNDYNHEKREAELRQFIENIAHQIKTPLAVLITEIEMDSGREKQLVQTGKIRQLLDMLLKIARLEAGKVNFERNDENMLNLLCNICSKLAEHYHNTMPENVYHICISGSHENRSELFKYVLQAGGWYDEVKESTVTPDELDDIANDYRAWCDYEWTSEALLNVIENSFKHTDADTTKEINICLSADSDDVKITISDSGEAVPEQYAERIFDRFFTGGAASYESTGIGLNLSKLIITQSGGDIRLKQIDDTQYFVITMPKYNLLKRRE